MVTFSKMTIPAADLGPMNPMPDIKNVSYIHAGYKLTDKISSNELPHIGKGMIPTMLPYRMQDGYTREKKCRPLQTAVVENEFIRAVFLPELGGRLYSLYDKAKRQELLYVNPVFQPCNLGLRNAWFSGGVEFNAGIKGHTPLTCSPLHTVIDKTPDGDVLRMYEYERIRGIVYSVSAWVHSTDPVLYLKCRMENHTDKDTYTYWWSNIAIPETPGTRVLVPAAEAYLSFYHADHYTVDKTAIPYREDMDVSYPAKIPSSRDFFYKIPDTSSKWIASVNEQGYGLLQCSSRRLYGRKMFVWGMGQGGRHWNEWLSEQGSAYIEIQAGLTHTQLEHILLPAGETWEWTEAYTLLEGNPSVLHGDYTEAVHAAEQYLMQRIGDPDTLRFPEDHTVTERIPQTSGSGWGYLEEQIRRKKISTILDFPQTEDPEILPWLQLLQTGTFPCPHPLEEPCSYVTGRFWLEKLENLREKSWHSFLQEGVIRYHLFAHGQESLEAVRHALEQSVEMCPNPWALRNLAMLYKTEYHQPDTTRSLLLQAYQMKPDCLPLAYELAMEWIRTGYDAEYLALYDTLSLPLQNHSRLLLCKGTALMHLGYLEEAAEIIREGLVIPDIKEGELSVSQLWMELYARIYAEEIGSFYDPEDAELLRKASEKYPLPFSLDYRMH